MTLSRSAQVRSRLGHPVIDGDAHILEFVPAFLDHVRERGGAELAAQYAPFSRHPMVGGARADWNAMSWEERRYRRAQRLPWWVPTAETDDWATVTLPALYHERLPECGLDFAVAYPTAAIGLQNMASDTARVRLCQLYNEFTAAPFRPYQDRLASAAVIPLNTPQEGIEALEHAVEQGLKVALIPAFVFRPIAALHDALGERFQELGREGMWMDTFGIDSEHEYDPFWARAVELRMPLACHTPGMGFTDRRSISNYMYNHMGHFAAAGEAICKSLFFGGVTQRFPQLRIGLLEGGVAAGCRIYADLVARWEKRGGHVIQRLDPARLDPERIRELFRRWGRDLVKPEHIEQVIGLLGHPMNEVAPENRDDFCALRIERPEDIRDAFVPNFFFGCEADDPLTAWAFDRRINPLGSRVRTIMGSDMGHWDVVDLRDPLGEAYETLVESGILDKEAFQEFAFDNQVLLYGGANPDFFRGTAVEVEAADVLARHAMV